jgi:hypothetical protein
MTWALCFNCGATKFGALCPCLKCNVNSTGDINLDIAFSDHHLAVKTLEEFGAVVKAIRQVCEEDELRFWSFIHYVSSRHPEVLRADIPDEERERCAEVLARANPPPVLLRKPENGERTEDAEEQTEGRSEDT